MNSEKIILKNLKEYTNDNIQIRENIDFNIINELKNDIETLKNKLKNMENDCDTLKIENEYLKINSKEAGINDQTILDKINKIIECLSQEKNNEL